MQSLKQKPMETNAIVEGQTVEVTSDYSETIPVSPDSTLDVEVKIDSVRATQQKEWKDATLEDLLAALSAARSKLQADLDKL